MKFMMTQQWLRLFTLKKQGLKSVSVEINKNVNSFETGKIFNEPSEARRISICIGNIRRVFREWL
jgi:hypothetical protein